jgi:hypothetical protein
MLLRGPVHANPLIEADQPPTALVDATSKPATKFHPLRATTAHQLSRAKVKIGETVGDPQTVNEAQSQHRLRPKRLAFTPSVRPSSRTNRLTWQRLKRREHQDAARATASTKPGPSQCATHRLRRPAATAATRRDTPPTLTASCSRPPSRRNSTVLQTVLSLPVATAAVAAAASAAVFKVPTPRHNRRRLNCPHHLPRSSSRGSGRAALHLSRRCATCHLLIAHPRVRHKDIPRRSTRTAGAVMVAAAARRATASATACGRRPCGSLRRRLRAERAVGVPAAEKARMNRGARIERRALHRSATLAPHRRTGAAGARACRPAVGRPPSSSSSSSSR